MPTFKLTEANDALVLAMICVGAIYSSRLTVPKVRLMMQFVKTTVQNNSNIYNRTMSGQTDGMGSSPWDVEELQALIIIQTIFTWHGEQSQRDAARQEYSTLAHIARAMGLCNVAPPGHHAYSILHYSQNGQVSRESWDWQGWLEQEKRDRALYLLFLTDAAMVMYFNCPPQFDSLEIRLPLPADDAAWDAKDREECANALGMNGPEAQIKNISGTRQLRQPGMSQSMRVLMEQNYNIKAGTTNAYGKFILIHALHIRIFNCQRALLVQPETPSFNGFFGSSGPNTPLSQSDFFNLDGTSSGTLSAANSGHATPTDGYGPNVNYAAQQEKKRLSHALDKWKRLWDHDMEVQFPPNSKRFPHSQGRRFGFSRDGVHFFYLARSFLQSSNPRDWTAPADVRFKQSMGVLKKIKGFVVGDNEQRGHDIGSVGDIDDMYGLDNLTLDMKLLFRPYNRGFDSPVAGVQTYSL